MTGLFAQIAYIGGLALTLSSTPASHGAAETASQGGGQVADQKGMTDGKAPQFETLPDEGRAHIPDEWVYAYRSDPPTSGPHYVVPTAPGFYTAPQAYGHLVHALEHGNVVIYYDPKRVSETAVASLRQLAVRYQDPFGGVIVTPRSDPQYEVIATAWTHRVRMAKYEAKTMQKFIDAYRAKGPEND